MARFDPVDRYMTPSQRASSPITQQLNTIIGEFINLVKPLNSELASKVQLLGSDPDNQDLSKIMDTVDEVILAIDNLKESIDETVEMVIRDILRNDLVSMKLKIFVMLDQKEVGSDLDEAFKIYKEQFEEFELIYARGMIRDIEIFHEPGQFIDLEDLPNNDSSSESSSPTLTKNQRIAVKEFISGKITESLRMQLGYYRYSIEEIVEKLQLAHTPEVEGEIRQIIEDVSIVMASSFLEKGEEEDGSTIHNQPSDISFQLGSVLTESQIIAVKELVGEQIGERQRTKSDYSYSTEKIAKQLGLIHTSAVEYAIEQLAKKVVEVMSNYDFEKIANLNPVDRYSAPSHRSSSPVGQILNNEQRTTSNELGGIDLNEINVNRQGVGVEIQFDPVAMQSIIDHGITGFAPVIINITPLPSVLPLLGLAPREDEDYLAISSLN